MSKIGKITVLILGLFVALGAGARAQDLVPMEVGSRAICASPLVNDPQATREAWIKTQLQHPGIFDAVRQWNLGKGARTDSVGDQYLFWVRNIQKGVFDTVRAQLKAIGSISTIWVALSEWNNGHVTSTEVDAMLSALEHSTNNASLDSTKGVLQIDRQVYGDPPNISSTFQKGQGDGKTTFLICDIQDGWTGTGGYVAGFFFDVDVDPRYGYNRSNGSNVRDMLYIDSYPGIFFNGNRRLSTALATLAHEFQHLIHWNYDPDEITFFNEGLSEYAEFLCGYGLRSPSGYFGSTNVTLTSWNSTLEDYSRAAMWTRYVAEQYGLRFIKNFVQNTGTGVPGFELSLAQSGYGATFAGTLANFFTANWLGSNAPDSADHYKGPVSGRPTLRNDYVDPNEQRADTVLQQGVQYISFASAKNFRVTFNLSAGLSVRAIESGPTSVRIRNVTNGVEFTSPELGTQFSSVVFVVINTQPVFSATYSYVAIGELLHFIVETSYDSGTPHAFSQGFAPYLGFGNNATTLGVAVRFQPEVKGNVLRKARMMMAFDQEFANGTTPATAPKNIVFHVWGDRSGRPGADLVQPFLVSVDRNLYPLGSFVDVDLSAYQSTLTNLTGPVYLGYMEDVNDTVATYTAVDNFVADDYSYVYRGPNYARLPNTWETMREVSAVNNHVLDGFNLMIRAVFDYSDSSSAPILSPGYLQNPLFSEFIDVVATSATDLRLSSLSGTISQTAGSVSLRFYNIPGTAKAFIDTTQLLRGNGTVSLRVRGAKKYGIFFADTTVSFSARLLKVDEPAAVSTPSGELTASFDAGALDKPVYVTACDGLSDPSMGLPRSASQPKTFSLGPPGVVLNRPTTLRAKIGTPDETMTLALYRDGMWLAVPSTLDPAHGEITATVNRLGVYGIVKKNDVGGQVDAVPTQFALHQNYPNPFNPATTIEFDVPRPSKVQLIVYDVLGKEVTRLVDGERSAGRYAVRFEASRIPSGVYFYRISADAFSRVKKLVVVK